MQRDSDTSPRPARPTVTNELVRRWAESPGAADALLPPDDEPDYIISRSMGRVLAALVDHVRPRSVLEFGAGRSSSVFAEALARIGGGRLTSVDHAPSYASRDWEAASQHPGVDCVLIAATLRLRLTSVGLFHRYVTGADALAARAPYDVVFVDGPPAEFGRTSPVFDAAPFIAPGGLVVLDDSARPGERSAVARWERALPCRRVVDDVTRARGMTILQLEHPVAPRFSPRTFVGTVQDELLRRRRRRSRRR